MRIRHDRSNQLCKKTRSQSLPQNLPRRTLLPPTLPPLLSNPLKLFIQHPLNRTLAHPQITGAQSPRKPPEPLHTPNLRDAVERIGVPPGACSGFIELETRFDDPDGVCGGGGGDAGEDCGGEGDDC
jgi:hypothetical protein